MTCRRHPLFCQGAAALSTKGSTSSVSSRWVEDTGASAHCRVQAHSMPAPLRQNVRRGVAMSHPESVGWWSGGSLSCGPPGIVSTVRVSVMLRPPLERRGTEVQAACVVFGSVSRSQLLLMKHIKTERTVKSPHADTRFTRRDSRVLAPAGREHGSRQGGVPVHVPVNTDDNSESLYSNAFHKQSVTRASAFICSRSHLRRGRLPHGLPNRVASGPSQSVSRSNSPEDRRATWRC